MSKRLLYGKKAEAWEQRDLLAKKIDDARKARAGVRTCNSHFNILK